MGARLTNVSMWTSQNVLGAGGSPKAIGLGIVYLCAVQSSAMPWEETYYPRSMRNLPLEARLKAIEIANALLEDGYDEGELYALRLSRPRSGPRAASDRNPLFKGRVL
jgi:hypothetical protein